MCRRVPAPLSGTAVQAPYSALPVLRRTSQPVTAAPPLPPAVHARVTAASPSSTVRPVGCAGAVAARGPLASAEEGAPSPVALYAVTRTV